MQACLGVVILSREAQVDGCCACWRFFPERATVSGPDSDAAGVRGIARGHQMIGMQIDQCLRSARINLRQRLPVQIDIFPYERACIVILPIQQSALSVDVMRGRPAHSLGRALMTSGIGNY